MVKRCRLAFALFTALFHVVLIARCGRTIDTSTTSGPQYLYVASGTTYAGNGVTMSTAINTIVRYTSDGLFDRIVQDFSDVPGDTPATIVDFDSNYLLVLVENALGRKLEKVAKNGSGRQPFLTNATALNGVMRDLKLTSDGGYLVSKSTAVEKFSSSKSRLTNGGNPYINAPGGVCATATTLTTRILPISTGQILMLHAAASPNNMLNLIHANGYSAVGDCIAKHTPPTANHFPTAVLKHSSGKIFVAYGNATGPVHSIYSYDVTAAAISNETLLFSDQAVLQGISSMVELADGSVLVSSASSTFNTVEKFTYVPTTPALVRVGSSPFMPTTLYLRSISSMVVSSQ